MIFIVATERYVKLPIRIRRGMPPSFRRHLVPLTYEELFFERAGPIGHYIFTDFDRLTRYEIETAAIFVEALLKAAPEARVLNHPIRVLERTPLLTALHREGFNDFEVVRLDTGGRPSRFPVFIRAEDGFAGPETDLIHDEAAFQAALADLARRGLPLKGRIAIGYAAEMDADGYFRKYAAFNIGGRIIAYHVQRERGWIVKRHSADPDRMTNVDRRDLHAADAVDAELDYIQSSPHEEHLRKAFVLAGIDYGRADYGIVGGRPQIYEINTNPNFGRGTSPRVDRRNLLRDKFHEAFMSIDIPIAASGRVRFKERRPRDHRIHMPRLRLMKSLARRVADSIGFRQANNRPGIGQEETAGGRRLGDRKQNVG